MKCPVCTHVDLVMAERSGVEIDYCPTCRGVWLDRGELDKIIERSSGHAQPSRHDHVSHESYAPHVRYNDGYGHYKKRKKENFLGDLFDF